MTQRYLVSEVWSHDISSHILPAAHGNSGIGFGFTRELTAIFEMYYTAMPKRNCEILFPSKVVISVSMFSFFRCCDQ